MSQEPLMPYYGIAVRDPEGKRREVGNVRVMARNMVGALARGHELLRQAGVDSDEYDKLEMIKVPGARWVGTPSMNTAFKYAA